MIWTLLLPLLSTTINRMLYTQLKHIACSFCCIFIEWSKRMCVKYCCLMSSSRIHRWRCPRTVFDFYQHRKQWHWHSIWVWVRASSRVARATHWLVRPHAQTADTCGHQREMWGSLSQHEKKHPPWPVWETWGHHKSAGKVPRLAHSQGRQDYQHNSFIVYVKVTICTKPPWTRRKLLGSATPKRSTQPIKM